MRRFPPRELPPRQPPERGRRSPLRPQGPFDRVFASRSPRDPAPFVIGGTVLFLGLLVLILFATPCSPLAEDDGGEEAIQLADGRVVVRHQTDMPPLPPELVAMSRFYTIDVLEEVTGLAAISVPLLQGSADPGRLAFYSFSNDRWQRVASVNLSGDGSEASGEFTSIPENLVVLRASAQRYQVAASLSAGGALHPGAQGLLTILSPRDYTPQGDGSLKGQATPLQGGGSTRVIPTIDGSDDPGAAAVAGILSDPAAGRAHIEAILRLASQGGFAGVDLEYTLADPSLRSPFTQFVQALAQALHEQGHLLSLTLPAATDDKEAGAFDWKALGAAADIIKVRPPQQPLAYWRTIQEALGFAVGNVPREKLFLVLSPFGTRQEGAEASPIGYRAAMFLAAQMEVRSPQDPLEIRPQRDVNISAVSLDQGAGASGLRWRDDVRAVAFAFGPQTNRTEIFLENVFSAAFKLELVQAFGLAGVSVAEASAEADVADIWPAVKALVETSTAVLSRPAANALTPQWLAPGGDISSQGGAAVWRPPSEGQHTIELVVSDGVLRFGRRLTVNVQAALEPTPVPLPTATETPPELQVPTPTPTPTVTPEPTVPPAATGTPTPGQTLTPTPPQTPAPTPTPTLTPTP